jgi:hypothetical protein
MHVRVRGHVYGLTQLSSTARSWRVDRSLGLATITSVHFTPRFVRLFPIKGYSLNPRLARLLPIYCYSRFPTTSEPTSGRTAPYRSCSPCKCADGRKTRAAHNYAGKGAIRTHDRTRLSQSAVYGENFETRTLTEKNTKRTFAPTDQ